MTRSEARAMGAPESVAQSTSDAVAALDSESVAALVESVIGTEPDEPEIETTTLVVKPGTILVQPAPSTLRQGTYRLLLRTARGQYGRVTFTGFPAFVAALDAAAEERGSRTAALAAGFVVDMPVGQRGPRPHAIDPDSL